MTLPSWLGGGQPFSFLGQPIANSFGRGIDSEIANWSTYGTPAQNSLNGGMFGGTTWAQGLGAAAGIGMGAYQLATAKGNTAQTIGGIGSMVGAGISLIPGMAPIGMGISMLSAILPSLLGGGGEYKWDPLAGANARFDPGANGYGMSESQQLGGKGIGGQYGNVAGTIDALFKATGGKVTPGMAMSGSVWNNQREGTTSTYVISPTQGSLQLSEGEGDQSAAVDRMIAKIFYMTATTPGALTGASPTLMTALANKEPTSTAAVSGLLDLIKTYDNLGKTTTKAEAALKAVDDSFVQLTAGAKEWGLSLEPVTAELNKQRKAVADDFLHTINAVLDPVGTALDDFAKERADGMKEWAYINDNVKETVIAQAKVEEYYAKKEAALRDQLYGGAVSQLEAAIQRMSPGGALANLDPAGQLAGLGASFRATYSQASAGDSAAVARLAGEGSSYAEYAQSYFAGSPEYNALRDEILANLRTIEAAIQVPAAGGTPLNTTDPALQNLVQQNAQLMQTVQTLLAELRDQKAETARTNNLLSRYLTNAA